MINNLFFNLIENGEGYVVDRIIKLLNIANNQLAMINGENSLMIYLVASHDDWQIEIRCGKNGINPLDANIEVEVGYRSVEDAIMQIGGQLVIGG